MKQAFDERNYSDCLRKRKKFTTNTCGDRNDDLSIMQSIEANEMQLLVPEAILRSKRAHSKRTLAVKQSLHDSPRKSSELPKLRKANSNNAKSSNTNCLNTKRQAMSILKPLKTNEMQALVSSSEFVKPPRKRSTRKSTFHGWTWEGVPIKKPIFIWPDKPPQVRNCYTTIRHYEGDIIRVRDSVLLRSGPKKTDLPFIAKVCDFWEAPETGDMMMSLLWYYRPEQTEPGRCPSHLPNEIFASKHRDVDSVACIDDKCYVLNYNEYCRYRKRQVMRSAGIRSSLTEIIVPNCLDKSLKHRLPPESVSSDIVFCCFKVYDFRQKRILKNPA